MIIIAMSTVKGLFGAHTSSCFSMFAMIISHSTIYISAYCIEVKVELHCICSTGCAFSGLYCDANSIVTTNIYQFSFVLESTVFSITFHLHCADLCARKILH